MNEEQIDEEQIDEEGIKTTLQQRGFELSNIDQLVEHLFEFSTFKPDILGVLPFVPQLMSQFGYEQTRALMIATALYKLGYPNLQALRDIFNDTVYYDTTHSVHSDLYQALDELLTPVEIQQVVEYAEMNSN